MIINLMKPDSLYNSGMKPLFYSEKQAKQKSKYAIIQILVGIEMDTTYVTIKTTLKEKMEIFFIR